MSKYYRLYLIESNLGKIEQSAPCKRKAITEFKIIYPNAKNIKVIAVMSINGWMYF
jgi:hypothetical protein